jgi:hypothetical protein
MSIPFSAEPSLPVDRGSLRNHLGQILLGLRFLVWQVLVPSNYPPEEIDPLPEPTAEVNEAQVKQCQWIFDQVEERRVHLEQKAQSTFGLMVFLVPFLVFLFVFIISRPTTSGTGIRAVAIGLLIITAVLLLLGFISAVRAVGVQASETFFLDSVIDKAGQFLEYDKAFRARGLLHRAAMSQAKNDQLAQFVKGAHILTAVAVVALVVAAVPTSVVLSSRPLSLTQTQSAEPADVSSPELLALRDEVTHLKQEIGKLPSNSQTAEGDLKNLEDKVAKLDAKLSEMQLGRPPD